MNIQLRNAQNIAKQENLVKPAQRLNLRLFLSLILCLTLSLFLSVSTAQETSDELTSTELQDVQALIEQAMKTDNQLVKILGAQIQASAESQQEIDGLTASLQLKTNEVLILEAETNDLKSQFASLAGQLNSSEQEISALQEQILERANQLQVVVQERDIIQSAFARVQDASDKSKIRVEELESLLATNSQTITSLETKVQTLEAQYQAALIGADTIKEEAMKLPDLQDQLATLSNESASLRSHIERVTNSRDRLKTEHERTLLEIDGFEQAMTDAILRASALEAQLRSSDTASVGQLQTLRRQYADAQSQIFSLEGSLEGARAEVERLQGAFGDSDAGALSESLSLKDEEISSLKDQIATLRTTIINLPNSDNLLSLQEERDALQTELSSLRQQVSNSDSAGNSAGTSTVAEVASTTTQRVLNDTPTPANAATATLAAALPNTSVVETTVTPQAETTEPLTPTAASELPANVDQAKDYAMLKLNEYYLFRDRVTDLGANVTLLELNQREEALINFQEAQSNVANLTGAEIYRVQPGDTLSDISTAVYGNINRWQDILVTNNYIINDPDVIFPGFELIIPQ